MNGKAETEQLGGREDVRSALKPTPGTREAALNPVER